MDDHSRYYLKVIYKIFADIVVIIHFLWIVFLVIGGFFGRRNRVIKFFHLGGLAFAFIIQIFDWYCPLTHLETWLRAKHDPSLSYSGSFIAYYLEKLIYIEVSQWIIFVLTVLLIVFNFVFYLKKGEV